VNVNQGEEESGGQHINRFVTENAALSADAAVICDSAMFAEIPSVTTRAERRIGFRRIHPDLGPPRKSMASLAVILGRCQDRDSCHRLGENQPSSSSSQNSEEVAEQVTSAVASVCPSGVTARFM
jgi:hypothetical protein